MVGNRRTLRYAAYVLLAAMLATALPPIVKPVHAQPAITVTPQVFGAGTTILVSGTGFSSAAATANIYLSSNGLLQITAGDQLLASVPLSGGAFTNRNVTVPVNTAPGTYYIKVTDGQSVALQQVSVAPPATAPKITLSPNQGSPLSQFKVSGTGLVSPVTVYFIGKNGPVPSYSCSGSLPLLCPVPTVPAGLYTVLVVDSSTPPNGASAPFRVTFALYPCLTQYSSFVAASCLPATTQYSVRAGDATATLNLYGEGLPGGSATSAIVYDPTTQTFRTATILTADTSVGSNGEFTQTYITILVPAGGLSPGVGYYVILTFTPGNVQVKSLPFIASKPNYPNFNACLSSPANTYQCTNSVSGSGDVDFVVQGYGFGSGDTVGITVTGPSISIVIPPPTVSADANGGFYYEVYQAGPFPAQSATVQVADPAGSNNVKTIGTFNVVPQLKISPPEGTVDSSITISGTSFPYTFTATAVKFTSLSNGYTKTVSISGNSGPDGTFPATPVDVPHLPGGNTSVTVLGYSGAQQFSITGYFWVDTEATELYYAVPEDNAWDTASGEALFPGEILDLQATGYPVGAQATVNFTRLPINQYGDIVMGATASSNGDLEIIFNVSKLPPTSALAGPYEIFLNNASAMMSLGQTIDTGFYIDVPELGEYAGPEYPHVYINPQNLTPASQLPALSPVFPTAYMVGDNLTVVGVGFNPSAKETVYIYNPITDTLTPLANITTSAYGTFSFTASLPNLSSYEPSWDKVDYSIVVKEWTNTVPPTPSIDTNAEAQTFNVMPSLVLVPDQGTPGSTFTAIGTGWGDGEPVSIYIQIPTIVPVATVTASSDGFFAVNVTVPSNVGTGVVAVKATGPTGNQVVQPFTVLPPPTKPQLSVDLVVPSSAYIGENVLIEVDVSVNGQPTNVPLSNISGTILLPTGQTQSLSFIRSGTGVYTTIFPVPNITGTYQVKVSVTYDSITVTKAAEFSVGPTTTVPTVNTTGIASTLSSIAAAQAALQSSLSSLQTALSNLAAQTTAAINALGSSIASLASSLSALSRQQSTATTYSLGALVIAFIALIVIIYGVFIRRMP